MYLRRLHLAAACLFGLLGPDEPAFAQGIRPGDERPPLPAPQPQAPTPPPLELPPLPEAPEGPLAAGLRVYVARFEITGSTIFSDAELAAAVTPYTGREISSEELVAARDAVTQLYVDAGYPTSGATIPDQDDLSEGVVRLEIVEGALVAVEVTGNTRFRDIYFRSRLLRAGRAPLDVSRLERALQILQQDPWIERVEGQLEPADRLGESLLRLHVSERSSYRLRLGAANDHSPSIGSYGGSVEGWLANPIGVGDELAAWFQGSEGLLDVEGHYEIPLTSLDTTLRLRFRNTETKIVEHPFDDLDVEATSRTYAVELAQPLYRDETDAIWAGIIGEYRTTHTSVLGEDFCFEPQTASCDDPTVSVLRQNLEWSRSTRRNVFALRSLLSLGVEAFDATTHGDADVPDGRYLAWLGQAQWAHVLPESVWGTQTLVRVDAQLTDDPLLSIERFAIGGLRSVRGYRENQLVRDSGVVVSGELRIPIWRDSLRNPLLALVPFTDYGYGWNKGPEPPDDTLWSLGVGLRFTPTEWLLAEIYWGGRLKDVPNPNDDLQDEGVYYRVVVDVF
ncbi:MAG TPA: ShlB/FhaC/HecB family hemolysin secretion/activation protein [Myxococcota bacterium]|nr:ShlB/FhaC/HecB family hemolysin secretion/activation protein [Myxococcota bacterium]